MSDKVYKILRFVIGLLLLLMFQTANPIEGDALSIFSRFIELILACIGFYFVCDLVTGRF